jgi:hypothetical protein
MPRKIRAKYGIDPVQRVEPFSFTDAQIDRLIETLPPTKSNRADFIAQLERCARDYRWIRNQYQEMPTRAEQNAALKEICGLACDLKVSLTGLDKDTEWELMSKHPAFQSGDFATTILDLVDRLEDFERAAKLAWAAGKKKTGPRIPTALQRTVLRLSSLYEAATGKRFTHNPKLKTQYDGTPRSRGGRFVVTFFEIVDTNVKQQSLSTAMASLMRSTRSARTTTSS